jgi:hypothetical protein
VRAGEEGVPGRGGLAELRREHVVGVVSIRAPRQTARQRVPQASVVTIVAGLAHHRDEGANDRHPSSESRNSLHTRQRSGRNCASRETSASVLVVPRRAMVRVAASRWAQAAPADASQRP